MTDECVLRAFEQVDRRADLHDRALMHDHDLVGKSEGLGLVVGHIDHRGADLLVQFLQLGPQLEPI